MKLLFLLALRNLLKHRARFIFTLVSVSLCSTFLFINLTLIEGSHYTMLEDMLKSIGKGTINIYHKDFKDKPSIRNTIYLKKEDVERLEEIDDIAMFFPKLKTAGLLSKGENTVGVAIEGTDIEKISRMGQIKLNEAPSSGVSYEILLGEALAEVMGVEIGDTVLIVTQDYYGSISVDLFRVSGLFSSPNPELEKFTAVMDLQTLQNFLLIPERITELSILTKNLQIGKKIEEKIKPLFDDAVALNWKEDLPEMKQLLELDSGGAWVFIYVLVFLVLLIIFTTIFMNTVERTKEYGIMMAMGTKSRFIKFIVVLEGMIIGVLGGFAGLLFGYILSLPISLNPLVFHVEMYSEFIGYSDIRIMTRILFSHFLYTFWITFIFSSLASFFPARRIAKLKPAEALRHV